MTRQYVACRAFGKRQAPLGPLGPEETTVHIGQPGFFSLGYTLCGRKVSRPIGTSRASEATCRDCRRRWQLVDDAGERPRTLVNEITKRLRILLRRS
jgi:hypothetical protein